MKLVESGHELSICFVAIFHIAALFATFLLFRSLKTFLEGNFAKSFAAL